MTISIAVNAALVEGNSNSSFKVSLVQVQDPSNRLAEAHLFLDHLVVDRLYTELFLKVDS